MNQLTRALIASGVKVPSTMERIWNYVADHPHATSRAVSEVLGLAQSETSAQLGLLVKRGMCDEVKQRMRVRSGQGWADRLINTYTVRTKTYELLPLPKVSHVPEKLACTIIDKPMVAAPEVKARPTLDVNLMPLGEARELYEQLKRVFG